MDSVIGKLKNNKSPGWYGLTNEFYKVFWADIREVLYQALSESIDSGSLSPSQRIGILTIIPKPKPATEHNFLYATLESMGFGNYLIKLIKLAFNGCMSLAKVNGHLSSPIYLIRGLHQGSPLSPILFLIVAQTIRSD